MSEASSTSIAATNDRSIAAFDFDGTLLNGDCLLILHSLVRSPIGRLLDGLRLIPALLLWKSGLRSTSWFKQLFLQMLLTPAMQGRSLEEQQKLLRRSLPEVRWQRLKPEAIQSNSAPPTARAQKRFADSRRGSSAPSTASICTPTATAVEIANSCKPLHIRTGLVSSQQHTRIGRLHGEADCSQS